MKNDSTKKTLKALTILSKANLSKIKGGNDGDDWIMEDLGGA